MLTILDEYKVNEIANKPLYIKEHKQKYNLKEIKQILIWRNICSIWIKRLYYINKKVYNNTNNLIKIRS